MDEQKFNTIIELVNHLIKSNPNYVKHTVGKTIVELSESLYERLQIENLELVEGEETQFGIQYEDNFYRLKRPSKELAPFNDIQIIRNGSLTFYSSAREGLSPEIPN